MSHPPKRVQNEFTAEALHAELKVGRVPDVWFVSCWAFLGAALDASASAATEAASLGENAQFPQENGSLDCTWTTPKLRATQVRSLMQGTETG